MGDGKTRTPMSQKEWLAFEDGVNWERARVVKLLEIGGTIETIICDYWGDPDFDKDDALVLIEAAIKGETND